MSEEIVGGVSVGAEASRAEVSAVTWCLVYLYWCLICLSTTAYYCLLLATWNNISVDEF